MADFYFFTDTDLLSEQPADFAFGPVGTNEGMDVFRVTSMHTASSLPNAYAICKGIVFIQEDTSNPDLVNLILKPIDQLDFNFPKIKFFIYRGLFKNELINGSQISAKTNNDLTRILWESQTARNASSGATDNPPKEALGIDFTESLADTVSIDEVFFRESVDFQLPIVNAGYSLGKFDNAGFGIEIMVESVGFDPTLANVRTSENLISVNSLPGSPTQPQEFEHWHDKEAILNYIDPCAFFGMFYHSKIRAKSSSGSSERLKKNDVYDNLLVKFSNKNTTYLDIRNEYNYSFNYFKNYGTSVKVAFDGVSTPSTLNYYRSGWPILILANSEFELSNYESQNTIRIQMPDGSGDNTRPLLYFSSGYKSDSYPKELKDKKRIVELSVASGFTDVISIATPNRQGLESATSISSYIKLKYNKRFDENNILPSSGTVIRARDYLDNLFLPFDLKIPFQGTSLLKSYVYDTDQYVDSELALGYDYVSNIGMARDSFSYVLFSFPDVKNHDSKPTKKKYLSIIGEMMQSNEGFLNTLAERFSGNLEKGKLTLTSSVAYPEISEAYLNFKDGKVLSVFLNPDLTEIVAVTFSISDFNSILALRNSNFIQKYRTYLGISLKENETDHAGIEYTRATLVLRGYWDNAGTIEVKEVPTGIKIYAHGHI